jgi:hypothetical protein
VRDQPLQMIKASEMMIKAIGIDLAKNVFQVHGVDEQGKVGSASNCEGVR